MIFNVTRASAATNASTFFGRNQRQHIFRPQPTPAHFSAATNAILTKWHLL
jgi:hypothetical protein